MIANLAPNVQIAIAGIFVILTISTLAVTTAGRLMPSIDFTELRLRTRSWWIMVLILCLAVVLGRLVSLLFLALLSFLALKEFLSIITIRWAHRSVLLWAYAAIPLQYYWIATAQYELFVITIPLYALLVPTTHVALIGATKAYLTTAAALSFGMLATVYGIGHLAYLLVLPPDVNPSAGSIGLALYLVFLVQFNDVVQYLSGKLFGRHKIVPKVSPKKSWEGLICGLLVTTVLAVLIAPWLTPLDVKQAFAAGLLIGLSGFAGDLTISSIKRDLGIKDTGTMIAGHGGILDRVDSLIFAAPLFFHFVYQLHY